MIHGHISCTESHKFICLALYLYLLYLISIYCNKYTYGYHTTAIVGFKPLRSKFEPSPWVEEDFFYLLNLFLQNRHRQTLFKL